MTCFTASSPLDANPSRFRGREGGCYLNGHQYVAELLRWRKFWVESAVERNRRRKASVSPSMLSVSVPFFARGLDISFTLRTYGTALEWFSPPPIGEKLCTRFAKWFSGVYRHIIYIYIYTYPCILQYLVPGIYLQCTTQRVHTPITAFLCLRPPAAGDLLQMRVVRVALHAAGAGALMNAPLVGVDHSCVLGNNVSGTYQTHHTIPTPPPIKRHCSTQQLPPAKTFWDDFLQAQMHMPNDPDHKSLVIF